MSIISFWLLTQSLNCTLTACMVWALSLSKIALVLASMVKAHFSWSQKYFLKIFTKTVF